MKIWPAAAPFKMVLATSRRLLVGLLDTPGTPQQTLLRLNSAVENSLQVTVQPEDRQRNSAFGFRVRSASPARRSVVRIALPLHSAATGDRQPPRAGVSGGILCAVQPCASTVDRRAAVLPSLTLTPVLHSS